MCKRVISVCLKAPTQPRDCFGIGVERHLGDADPYEPPRGQSVARREAERLVDVGFGFRAAIKENFGKPDETVSKG